MGRREDQLEQLEEPRFYSQLAIKAVDEEQRIIEGIASTPSTDRMGDIVEPKGALFKLPMPFLFQHNKAQPLGHVIAAKVTDAGISIKAQIAKGVAPFIDDAWALIKSGLVSGLSIGFKPIETADIDGTWGMRFIKWEWLELSAVTIAANSDASIHSIKGTDDQLRRAALGITASGDAARLGHSSPGASGKSAVGKSKGNTVSKTTGERIAEYEAKRAANAGRMQAMMDKSNDDGETLDQAAREEYDTLTQQIKEIDDHLARYKQLEQVQISRASDVSASDVRSGAEARGGSVLTVPGGSSGIVAVRRNLPPGTAFARYAQALAASKGVLIQALEMARNNQRWKDTPEVEITLKTAVVAGTTTSTSWAGPLVVEQTMVSEFIELLRPQTIVGKLTALRRVPFNIRVAGKTSGSTVGWVGQGSPKRVSELVFNETTLGWAKAAGIVVISQELARFSDPSAEAVIRQDLIDTMSVFMDAQFIDPAVAAVANVSPASITNGLTAVTATGTSVALITADIQSLFNNFINNDIAPKNPTWIMHPLTALGLSLKRTAQDIFAFPDINMNGGTFFGIPVITSRSVPKSTSGGTIIVLLDQSEIFFADDGQVSLDASQEASLQLDSAPSTGAQSLVSLWQNNLIGIRAERYMNWARRRNTAVTYLDAVPTY